MRAAKYKPLLFTTTIRNPQRFKLFLGVLKEFNGKVLSEELIYRICKKIINEGLYTPTQLSPNVRQKLKAGKELSERELKKILKDNPQKHKEAGFSRGWASRFDTWFKPAKEMGFVFYKEQGILKFSKIGLKLADIKHPEFEQEAFLNSYSKYQRNNPFRRVLNENIPLILLLEVIKKLNSDKGFKPKGISKLELPLLIYWKDNNAQQLYLRIKKLRKYYGYDVSSEVVIDICRNEIMQGQDIKRDAKSIMGDYPDEFIRKMRLTGLITLRGGGRFIDVNTNENTKINYIIKQYSNYKKYKTEESYFKYISQADRKLVSFASKTTPAPRKEFFLKKWVKEFTWDNIKKEMLILSRNGLSKDETLKYLSHPVRLEFLTALAIKSRYPKIKVIPNYPIDDEGIPTSTAAGIGNKGDIECFEGIKGVLIEVTMMQGRIQTVMEIWPIERHLKEFKSKYSNSMCYFIAPSIFSDSHRQIEYVSNTTSLTIIPQTIKEFLKHLETKDYLHQLSR